LPNNYFVEAILGNSSSSFLYAHMLGAYMKIMKPNASIQDTNAVISSTKIDLEGINLGN
jgi:hypothetical protein